MSGSAWLVCELVGVGSRMFGMKCSRAKVGCVGESAKKKKKVEMEEGEPVSRKRIEKPGGLSDLQVPGCSGFRTRRARHSGRWTPAPRAKLLATFRYAPKQYLVSSHDSHYSPSTYPRVSTLGAKYCVGMLGTNLGLAPTAFVNFKLTA